MIKQFGKYNFWNILYELLVRMVNIFTFYFKKREIANISLSDSQSRKNNNGNVPVFIIGPPRTGSTFTYQLITNLFDVSYIDNLVDIFYRFPLFGLDISNRLFNDKPHNCYKSKHGNTLPFGLHAPSECGNYWYRFLSRQRYYVTEKDMNENDKEQIKKEFRVILNRYQKPFVIKNLSNSLRLRLIYDLFPEAKVIIVDRNDDDTLSSIMKVREKNGTPSNKIWSVAPPELSGRCFSSEKELVKEQIRLIHEYIEKEIQLFNKENVLWLKYEEIKSGSLDDFKKSLEQFLKVKKRTNAEEPGNR